MPPSSTLIDTTLADGVCLFRTGGGWALRRPDGLFVRHYEIGRASCRERV